MKTKIKKALTLINAGDIVLINSERFLVIYSDLMCEKYHGEYEDGKIFIYNSRGLNEMIQKDLDILLPDYKIYVM